MLTKLVPANNIWGVGNLSTSDLDLAINLEVAVDKLKDNLRYIVDNSYSHLRDDNKLLKLVNDHYLEYFSIYKNLYPDWWYVFLDSHDLKINWPFWFKDILETQEIKTEKEFAIFMYKALKFYVYLIAKDNPDFTSTDKMKISLVLYNLFQDISGMEERSIKH